MAMKPELDFTRFLFSNCKKSWCAKMCVLVYLLNKLNFPLNNENLIMAQLLYLKYMDENLYVATDLNSIADELLAFWWHKDN